MQSIEFGVHGTERRLQSASESVVDSFQNRIFDIDERWDERLEFFPEFAQTILKIKELSRRRQDRYKPENFRTEGMRHTRISHEVQDLTGFSHLFSTDVLLNRAFGQSLPEVLDDNLKVRVERIAQEMIIESNGIASKSDFRSVNQFMAMVFRGEIGIDYQGDLEQSSPGQIDFGLI